MLRADPTWVCCKYQLEALTALWWSPSPDTDLCAFRLKRVSLGFLLLLLLLLFSQRGFRLYLTPIILLGGKDVFLSKRSPKLFLSFSRTWQFREGLEQVVFTLLPIVTIAVIPSQSYMGHHYEK